MDCAKPFENILNHVQMYNSKNWSVCFDYCKMVWVCFMFKLYKKYGVSHENRL